MNSTTYRAGIDIGSTTIKMVITNNEHQLVFSGYDRHHADIPSAIKSMLESAMSELGADCLIKPAITGSAGMGVSEKYGISFIQEVVAASNYINFAYPEIRTLIDIGGEDTKMVFFNEGCVPDIRMNGSCAGGTGAFIDQMATLLAIDVSKMGELAETAKNVYPIASRCGVFSKTDIQNLIARNVSSNDIAASVFHAVAMQTITTLARGNDPKPVIFFCGGPLAFIPALRQAFIKALNLNTEDYVLPENAALIPAFGCAVTTDVNPAPIQLSALLEHIESGRHKINTNMQHRLKPLFNDEQEIEDWIAHKQQHFVDSIDLKKYDGNTCFIGIDSGSTTTKIVAIDPQERVLFRYYSRNKGNPLKAVSIGLNEFLDLAHEAKKDLLVTGSSVTGYGEDLIKAAFNLNYGLVETIAHYSAAHKFSPNVSFILDIGGQDMKAIFVENGTINRLEINEACSSGCGSFIEGFAGSLKYTVANFAALACKAQAPCDLGTRCTVFMNSKVKQFLREGASVGDISAGLAYSVVKNCLYKVLKLKDPNELGEHIVVQGGTMRNHAVVRALELLTGKNVMFTDMPELMGAYGAALYSCHMHRTGESAHMPVHLAELSVLTPHKTEQSYCSGCENNCIINKFDFINGNIFFSGNKCEKIYTNKGEGFKNGKNHYLYKYKQLLVPNKAEVNPKLPVIGIPRVLNMFENFPFWNTLLTECGFEVKISGRSTFKMYEQGLGTVMSDNICFPAKLVHGHIFDLVHKKVDRILMPYVIYESREDKNVANSFNCPIVSGYSDVIKSAIDTHTKHGIPVDAPSIVFNNKKLLENACIEYISAFGISKTVIVQALEKAELAQSKYFSDLQKHSQQIFDEAASQGKMIIMLAGRPYHTDPLIQHKISEMVASFGIDVISEDLVRQDSDNSFANVHAVMQWAYTNRIIKAANFVAESNSNIHFVQMTSFGCGPDAFIIDEVNDILKHAGKNLSLLKIDDVNNIGSLRLRIRSLIDSLKFSGINKKANNQLPPKVTPIYQKEDRKRKILVPFFSEFYSPFVPVLFKIAGYDFETLPPADEQSSEFGLKFSNNEICFPATVVVGDIIKALNTGKYKSSEIAIGISQTGGQCRATNYIALIKKAMVAAGYSDIPVISIASGDSILNPQPGFEVKWRKAILTTALSMLYADCISKMYYSTVVREKIKGGATFLRDKYINEALAFTARRDKKGLLKLLEKAVAEFNEMCADKDLVPRIGIVGEIYVKYNAFGNRNVVNWLVSQGVEVVVPSLVNFFLQYFANYKINIKQNIEQPTTSKWIVDLIYYIVDKNIKKIEKVAGKYKYYRPFSNIYTDAEKASKVVNLAAQFGEGWLIPAEIANFAEEGVNNAVSLQPFGCIANHVIAKGVEKRMKTLFPHMNMLFLDFDSGTSDVNILNRLHFMIKSAQENESNHSFASHAHSRQETFVEYK